MKILIDVAHPAQLNFYLNAIRILGKKHTVLVTYLKRGKLPHIVKKEVPESQNVKTLEVGSHKGNKLSIIFHANLFRIFKMFWITLKFMPDIEFSNGYVAGVGPRILSIPSCHFQDDPEIGKKRMRLMMTFADKIYVPFYTESKKIKRLESLKEWAYLSPKYFNPNPKILADLNLDEKEYIFIREVITTTFNYQGQEEAIIESIAGDFPKDYKIILSLEDKSRAKFFPSHWHILEEPVKDIHSIIYYSCAVISSGDSMAREGAQLGVPSYYCGKRMMHANNILIKEGMLFHINKDEVVSSVKKIINGEKKYQQNEFRHSLFKKWDDINEIIINEVENIKIKNL